MVDHFSICVNDLQVAKAFYRHTLAPLGYELRVDNEQTVSFGEPRGSDPGGDFRLEVDQPKPFHFAFNARTHEEVVARYHAALAAGGTDNGAPS